MISVEQQVGRYKILSTLGAGGMGEVFLAQDTELDRLVAIKILPNEFSAVSERVHRFIQEAKAVSALNHPNILTIYEVGLEHGTRFIVSEYIKGETLRDKLKNEYLKISTALDYSLQIASALESAHSRSIIHRDIKPENIMIREDNLVKVLDFGLAKLSDTENQDLFTSQTPTREHIKTKSGMIIGTFSYMSPEQARGKHVDFRTDIFSFGVVMYEMLTGVQPFTGETTSDMIAAILKTDPEKPRSFNREIPLELESIVLKSLAKSPGDRFQTFGEIVSEIKTLKLQFDFRRQNLISENPDRIFPDAKTEILDADTSQISQAITEENSDRVSNPNLFSRFTSKIHTTAKISSAYYWLPAVLLAAFLAFLFIPFKTSQPASAAVKLYDEGVEALREGTYFKASKLFEEAINADETFTKAHASLAEAWMEMDYLGRAQSEMLKVNELEKSKASLLPSFRQTDDSLYLEAVNALALRDYPKAIKIYQQIVQNHPESSNAYLDLGRAFEKNEDTDSALENFRKASELDPQSGAAFLRIGVSEKRKADFSHAEESFKAAEKIFDKRSNDEAIAEVRLQRGISLNLQEKIDQARLLFDQIVNMPRANPHQKIRALLQISNACAGEGKSDCAEQYATSALRMAKDERMENVATGGLIDLGNAFLIRADYPRAEQYFQQALDYAGKDGGARSEARARLSLASLRIQQKKPVEAENFVAQTIPFLEKSHLVKELVQAKLILGRALDMKADYKNALTAFEQVENSQDAAAADRAYAKMISGKILSEMEDYPAALEKFEQSFQLYQSLNNSFYSVYDLFYLSDVSVSMGRFEDAQNYLNRAGELIKSGDSLSSQIEARRHLMNAQIALRRQNYGEAIKEAKLVGNSKSDTDKFNADLILCEALTLSESKNKESFQSCLAAVKFADGTNDSRTINYSKLTLARAYLNTGAYQQAVETALATKDYSTANDIRISLWEACIISAIAYQRIGDDQNSKKIAAYSLEVLDQIKTQWGDDNYKTYISIPLNKLYLEQAEKMANS